jgi:hypothetical protein
VYTYEADCWVTGLLVFLKKYGYGQLVIIHKQKYF